MKKAIYLTCALLLITTNGHALIFNHGPYFGGQIGWGQMDEGNGYKKYVENITSSNIDLGTFTAWRAYAGYSLLPLFSVEVGYTHYPENKYSSSNGKIINESYAIDGVGKITIPLGIANPLLSPFSIYGKGGFAYMRTDLDNQIDSIKKITSSLRPTFGGGLIFNFTPEIAVDASWSQIVGKSRVASANSVQTGTPIPSANLYTLGLSYKVTGIF